MLERAWEYIYIYVCEEDEENICITKCNIRLREM